MRLLNLAAGLVDRLTPSVPRSLRARTHAAAQSCSTTPAPVTPTPAGAGQTPKGGVATAETASPFGPPAIEMSVHPSQRARITDAQIYDWLNDWSTKEER